jgi:hypothetical protein
MYILNDKLINIYAPFETAEGVRYANLTSQEVRDALGVVEMSEPAPPEDYSEDTYYRTEQPDVPYIVYARKSDEQIAAILATKIQAQIDVLEKETMLPRVVREYMLLNAEMVAAANGLDPMTNIGYRKVKELDQAIAALRSQLP